MKINICLTLIIIISMILNIVNYNYFLILLSVIWYVASVLIMYSGIKYSLRYRFMQLNVENIINGIKSKSKNSISPLSSLCISLAAKIGVGSLSGVALAIYYGGIGTIFWLCFVSFIIVINTILECKLGIRYREKIDDYYVGGPSYYIRKCLGNKYLSYLYGILVIIGYGILFLSIQSNTIISTVKYFDINYNYFVLLLFLVTLFVIIRGINGISKINSFIVPLMLLFYLILGMYVFILNINIIPNILINTLKEAFNIKSIISVFLIGMQRAIFITESSIGTSAISASTCDNEEDKQAMLEVLGIYITIFLVCLTTFIIIVTSNYSLINFNNINGIELVLYSFKYHFGNKGSLILSVITILFAFSTIISSYYFGESNLGLFSKNKKIRNGYMIIFMLVIVISCYVKANILWNLIDFLVAILAIINVYSILKIYK